MSSSMKIESGRTQTQTNPRTWSPRGARTTRRRRHVRTAIDILETRSLLSTIVGQVINDVNGTGFRAEGDAGISGVTITLDQFNPSTGKPVEGTTPTTTTTNADGFYQFTGLGAGSYLVTEPAVSGTFQTAPTAEETPQSYLVQFTTNNQTAGGPLTTSLVNTDPNWLASMTPAPYTFPLAGDFLFQLGPSGTAPTRVFLSGQATVATDKPQVTTSTSGDGTTTTDVTVPTTMTSLQLVGTVSSDQHGQGYLGTITMTLNPSAPSTGQITSRSDSNLLVDSSFNINATITIPDAFGTQTVLHTSVPINFLAKELSQFPGFGGNYAHNGTGQPISLLDQNNQEQGTLIFGNLAPMPGYDFANFGAATINVTATYLDSNGVQQPLMNQPIIFQKVAEVAGPSSEGGGEDSGGDSGDGGSGGSNGSSGPPAGMGPAPTTPMTCYTDANGNLSMPDLGPGSYTFQELNGTPLTLNTTLTQGLGSDGQTITIPALQSGFTAPTTSINFVNNFEEKTTNQSTAPPSYGTATQTIIPNLNIGGTAYANDGSPAYINDGVSFGSALYAGATDVPLKITVVVPQGDTAYLSGWLDAVHNGTFIDTGGTVPSDLIQYNTTDNPTYASLDNMVLTAGVHNLTLNIKVPTDAVAADTFARFRLTDSTAMNTGPTGTGGNGEVEDIPVTIYDQSQLASITGQTFEDTNGDGVMSSGEPIQDGWTVALVNMDNGQTVATTTSGPLSVTSGGQTENYDGVYQFLNVIPGHYQVVATPPPVTGLPAPIITAPASDESATTYQLDVQAGQQYGSLPTGTTIPTSGGLDQVPAGTESLYTLAQFMIIKGSGGHAGSGGSGESGGTGGTDTNQPIRISVLGDMSVYHNTIDQSGLLPSKITGLTLTGLAVSQSEEGGPVTILGPVSVTLQGLFDTNGTIGPSTSGETTGDVASYAMYIQLDLSAFGYGVVTNTRPLNVSGTVTQIPFYNTVLKRSGGGSPIPLRSENSETSGTEPLRLVSASFTTMYGLNEGSFYPGTISGTVYNDKNANNQVDTGEGGLAGATVTVTQVSTEGPSGEEGGGEEGGGGGGGGMGGGGETTPPPVYITKTDAQGNWSITNLGPGSYTVTETPPHAFGNSGGTSFNYPVTITSRGAETGKNFLNYPINQPPVIAAPGGITGMEDSNLTFSAGAGNGISVSDEDAGTNPVQVTLSTPDGTLNLPETTGLTITQGAATGSSQIIATGTIDAINAALAGLTLSPTAHFNGTGSLTISVDDLGNSGNGGPKTSTTIIPLDISAVADAPALNLGNAHGSASNQIPLGISVSRGAGANTETLSVMISGVPAGAVLTGGTDLGNGQWQLTPQQLTGLAIVSPNSGTYPLTVTATATEPSNGSTATTVLPLSVTVDNIVPQIYSAGDQTATVNDPTAINLGNFWDTPTDGAWNVVVNWGDATSSAFSDGATGQIGVVPHTYTRSGRFTVTVAVQDKNGGASTSQFLVTVGPTEVAQVQIANGTAQRSMIRSLTVTFSGPVNILPGAFTLRDQRGRTVKLNVATSLVNGQTVATLTFKGQRIVGGSLWDGKFTLSINGGHILDATTGQATDAALNGLAGSQAKVQFRRRFGDIDGDGVVNRYDMQQFRKAFGSRAGQSRYVSAFDYNSNNLIAGGDQLQIRDRLMDYLRTQDQIKKQDRLHTT